MTPALIAMRLAMLVAGPALSAPAVDPETPTGIKGAGKILYCEWDPPLALKLLAIVGWGWLLLGLVTVFLAARRGPVLRVSALYLAGALVVIGFFMGLQWCGDPDLVHRFTVLWNDGGWYLSALPPAACAAAAVLGRLLRKR